MEWCFYHEDYFSYSNTLYTFTTCTTKTKINPFCFSQEMGELIGYLQLFRTIFKRFYCFPKKQKNTMTNQQQEKENFTMLHTSTSSIQGFYIKYFTQTHQNTIQSHLECIKKKLQETKKPIDSHIFQFLDQLDHLLTKTFLKNLKQFRQEWINITFFY
jgi:hypothetical protein